MLPTFEINFSQVSLIVHIYKGFFFFLTKIFCLCKLPDTQGWSPLQGVGKKTFSRGRCHLLLGLKQGYPFTVHSYSHPSEAWLVEREALPPQFYKSIMVKCLALGHKCHDWDSNQHSADQKTELESVALRPWHATLKQPINSKNQIMNTSCQYSLHL